MNSCLADIQNISNSKGFGGGTITAAEFLKEFVDSDVKWAHLDIANMDHFPSNSGFEVPGSAAFGIKLLNEFVSDFEKTNNVK
jgi:leucyl aminopeptidase